MALLRCRSWMLVLVCYVAAVSPAQADAPDLRSAEVDWPQFLARSDLLWTELPRTWYEGPYTGNGRYGAMMHLAEDGESFIIKVNRGDVQDHRPELGTHNGLCRLPIGRFHLRPVGNYTGCDLRLDLWNAELRGHLTTDQGRIEIHQYTHATKPVIVTEITRHGGEAEACLDWEAYPAISPRQVYAREGHDSKLSRNYTEYGPPRVTEEGGRGLCVQDLAFGWQTATAWRQTENGAKLRLLVAIAHAQSPRSAEQEVQATIDQLHQLDPAEMLASHRQWWHKLYPRSFVSIPDNFWQSFYWIQLYKIASTTRADGMLIDTCGVWLEPDTLWPLAWWNLNTQLTYWLPLASNHADLVRSMTDALDRNSATLSANASRADDPAIAAMGRTSDQHCFTGGSGPELSNLTWALHNYWLLYRHTMDEAMLRERIYPLLTRSIQKAMNELTRDEDGVLHTPEKISPEYLRAPDTNYDLALVRWGLMTLIDTAERFEIDEPRLATWRETLRDLRPYPVDETGFQVAAGRPLTHGHRHYSHLLMIYPLYTVNWDDPASRPRIEKSVTHWAEKDQNDGGYQFTGAASMYASMGKGDVALDYLNRVRSWIRPNTMYLEAGPVIETPFSAAQSLLDMLIQSWGGKIRVFPAVSNKWRDVSFADLSAQGAFLVSAVRRDGQTRMVRVKSLAGEPCRIVTDLPRPFRVLGDKAVEDDGTTIEAQLAAGEELVLYVGEKPLLPTPVEGVGPANPFGLPAAGAKSGAK